MSTLSPAQIAKLRSSAKPPKPAPRPEYDSAPDAELAGMFGRRWHELEQFDRMAKSLYSILNWATLLWNNTRAEDVPILMSLATRTTNTALRKKACICLRSYLADCSGDQDMSLKPEVTKTLEGLGEPLAVARRPGTYPPSGITNTE